MSTLYDVIIVGGGPMGLSAAYECYNKGKKVLVIEEFEFHNDFGSSPGFSRQFRISYSERHLCELANLTSPLWDSLMSNLGNSKLLSRTGCLWFGDSTVSNSEGNIKDAIENLIALDIPYEHVCGAQNILKRWPFVGKAIEGIESPEALFMDDGGTVNVPELIQSYVNELQSKDQVQLLTNTKVTGIDYSQHDKVVISTSTGQSYEGVKVILTPGAYVNETLSLLTPAFGQQIKFTIYLWVSTYYQLRLEASNKGSATNWPIWYFFGQPYDTDEDGSTDFNAYYGFPSDNDDQPNQARVCPAFTSKEDFDFDYLPPPPEDQHRPSDESAVQYTQNFVKKSMPTLKDTPVENKTTCIAGFAELVSGDPDASAGFVLDFLPGTDKRIVLTAGGWGMKYIPVMGIILADLAVDGQTTTEYARLVQPMNISRGVLEPVLKGAKKVAAQRPKLTASQRAAKFIKMFS